MGKAPGTPTMGRIGGTTTNGNNMKVYSDKNVATTYVNQRFSSFGGGGNTSSYSDESNTSFYVVTQTTNVKRGTDWAHLALTIGMSLLAWPTCYFCNQWFANIEQNDRAFWMMIAGFLLLTSFVVLVYAFSKVEDWLFYGCSVFAFTAVIDLIITLEFFGVIQGYMTEYLKFGEPYLFSSWGMAIALFDAVGFYFMYLLINFQLANRKSWRSVGIYWGSGLINSMIAFLLAVFCGKEPTTPCTFLNVPYAIFPVAALQRAFARAQRPGWISYVKPTFFSMLVDVVSGAILCTSIWLLVARGLSVLGCESYLISNTVQYEKALHYKDPAPYATIQALVFLFYLVPLQLVSFLYHFKEIKPQFLWELALVQAGGVLQAQFSYMVYSFVQQTPADYRVDIHDKYFWISNLIITLAPHFLLLQLRRHRNAKERFTPKILNKHD